MPYIKIKGHNMFYEDRGEGFPLIFGHSYLWDSTMWEPQVQELSSSYRCIVPEVWGHGKSEPPPEIPYSIEALADDYWTFSQALELKHFAIIGLSVGGMWGVHLTLNHPEAVTALVLLDTYVGPEPEDTCVRYFKMMEVIEQMVTIPPSIIEPIVPQFFSPVTIQKGSNLVKHFTDSLLSIPQERIPSILAIGKAIFGRSSVLNRLGEIKVPTMVIVGADDLPRPPHESQQMAQYIKDSKLEVIPEAGHISNLEQPEEVARLLDAFFKETLPMKSVSS